MKSRPLATLAVAMALVAWKASADVFIDTFYDPVYPSEVSWPSDCDALAQTFQAPTGNPVLVSWEFESHPRFAPSGEVEFSIYQWSGGAPVGTSLFDVTVPWIAGERIPQFSGINLELTPGLKYGAVINLQGYDFWSVRVGPNLYTNGTAFFLLPYAQSWSTYAQIGLARYDDLTFKAQFAPVPEPSLAALFGLGLGMCSNRFSRRRAAA